MRELKKEKTRALLVSLGLMAMAVAGFVLFRGRWTILPLSAVPWIAVFLAQRSDGSWKLDRQRNDPNPSVALPFFLPGLILLLLTVSDTHPVQWPHAIWMTITIVAIMFGLALRADHSLSERPWNMILVFLVLLCYGYGRGMQINAVLDRSNPSFYPTRVLGKRMVTGRNTTYHLQVEAWGPRTGGEESVSRSIYQSVEPGDQVCVTLREGALRVAWYTISRCG